VEHTVTIGQKPGTRKGFNLNISFIYYVPNSIIFFTPQKDIPHLSDLKTTRKI
jgi:hypothetical protein